MSDLSEAEVRALHEALEDEYRAFATYSQVVADFGEVPPFANIRHSEARHIAALATLFERHGLLLPANTWPGRTDRYASLEDACRAGVAAETENKAMYDRLLAACRSPDVIGVLRNLQEASEHRHLPAFERCSQRGGGRRGTGSGGRRFRGGRKAC